MIQGQYFDGRTSTSQPARLEVQHGNIVLQGDNLQLVYPQGQYYVEPRVANIAIRLVFDDGAIFEIPDQPGIEQILHQLQQDSIHKLVHKLENNLAYIVITLLLAIAVLVSLVHYGVPQFAKSVANKIPLEYETRMGEQTLAFFDKSLCQPSKLANSRQQQLREKMLALFDNQQVYRIEFRQCKAVGANAMALPSGIILFTDEMVKLAKHDDELLGVFAHEAGHVEYRHTLRHVLQDSVTGLLIVMLTGDIGTASSMAAALPAVLLQTKFSRDFEREADSYAAQSLLHKNKDPVSLANILARLDQKYEQADETEGFLSTHPLTRERVNFLTTIKNNAKKGEHYE